MSLQARTAVAVVGCALLWSLLGCGAAEPEAADRTIPPLPRIDSPKDASGSDPCSLLSNSELARLGLTAGSPWQGTFGPGCDWRGDGSLAVTIMISTDAGLGVVAQDSDPAAARVRISGYPALETFTRQGVYCRYDLGNAPDQVLIATMTGGSPDSCSALQTILIDVLRDLPRWQA